MWASIVGAGAELDRSLGRRTPSPAPVTATAAPDRRPRSGHRPPARPGRRAAGFEVVGVRRPACGGWRRHGAWPPWPPRRASGPRRRRPPYLAVPWWSWPSVRGHRGLRRPPAVPPRRPLVLAERDPPASSAWPSRRPGRVRGRPGAGGGRGPRVPPAQCGVKLAFNLGHFSLEARSRSSSTAPCSAMRPGEPWGWVAAFGATLLLDVLCALDDHRRPSRSTTAASTGRLAQVDRRRGRRRGHQHEPGLLAVIVLERDVARGLAARRGGGDPLPRLPGLQPHPELRAHRAALRVHAARSAGRCRPSRCCTTMLTQARDLLRADVAEITLFGAGDDRVRAPHAEGDGRTATTPARRDGDGDPWWPAVAGGEAVACRPRGATSGAASVRRRAGRHGGAPRGDAGVDRHDDRGRPPRRGEHLRRDDLRLFETLANHASVALDERDLVDRLRDEAAEKEHQALHDHLTGLPNRRLFRRRVTRPWRGSGRAPRGGRHADGPRPVQGDQRHARPPHRRPAAPRGRRPAAADARARRHDRPARRRRVRHPPGRDADAGAAPWRRPADLLAVLDRRSPSTSSASRSAPASASRCRPEHGATPTPCSSGPTSRCTTAKAAPRRASSSTTPSATSTAPAGWRSPASCAPPIEEGSSSCTTSRRRSVRPGRVAGVEALVRWQHPTHGWVAARRVHPARRAHRPDPPADPVRPRRSARAGGGVAADGPRPADRR